MKNLAGPVKGKLKGQRQNRPNKSVVPKQWKKNRSLRPGKKKNRYSKLIFRVRRRGGQGVPFRGTRRIKKGSVRRVRIVYSGSLPKCDHAEGKTEWGGEKELNVMGKVKIATFLEKRGT